MNQRLVYQSGPLSEESMGQELESCELDAIAGGCGDTTLEVVTTESALPTITVEGPAPKFRGPSLNLLQAIARDFSS